MRPILKPPTVTMVSSAALLSCARPHGAEQTNAGTALQCTYFIIIATNTMYAGSQLLQLVQLRAGREVASAQHMLHPAGNQQLLESVRHVTGTGGDVVVSQNQNILHKMVSQGCSHGANASLLRPNQPPCSQVISAQSCPSADCSPTKLRDKGCTIGLITFVTADKRRDRGCLR